MEKIKVEKKVVEIEGEEMKRIIWKLIKEKIINKYIEIEMK